MDIWTAIGIFGIPAGILAGWGITHFYYRKTSRDNQELRKDNKTLRDAIEKLTKLIDERIEQPDLSKEEKEHLKAQTEAALQGLFHTYPWEAKYAKSLMGEDDNPSLIKKLANLSRHSTSKPRPKPGVKGEDNSLVE